MSRKVAKKAVKKKVARKKAAKKKAVKRRTAAPRAPRLKKEEVGALLDQLQSEERSERVWNEMTSPDPDPDPGDGDHWTAVEERWRLKPAERDHQLRRWKHFGK
ncbi:MAG: hypothetical protein ABII00_01240 [Elusimicrobiota bacterium]